MDPKRLYGDRLGLREAEWRDLERRWRALSRLRLLLFLLGAALLVILLILDASALWLLLPVAGFLALAGVHARVHREREARRRDLEHYRQGLDRLEGNWVGRGPEGSRWSDASHPYADHLDLFGEASLFQRLCRARSLPGQETLANWLRIPADLATLQARREAVEELAGELDLRERLDRVGESTVDGLDPGRLGAWSAQITDAPTAFERLGAAALALMIVTSLAGWVFGLSSGWFFLAALAAGGFLEQHLGRRLRPLLASVEEVAGQLDNLARLTEELEEHRYRSRRLVELRERVRRDTVLASVLLRMLRRRMEWYDSSRNLIFAPFAFLLLWRVQLGLAVQQWMASNQQDLAGWLGAVGEFEALLSLSSYAFENPEDVWPEWVEELCYDGVGLGHPLLPSDHCIRNDLRLGDDLRLYVISGSNMSGKSTLLRTVGLNAVLALAGAPVRARQLRLSPLAVGASLRIVDSLPAGISHFYAEVKRLRELRELVDGPLPALLLLDEIFHGTNSHDRRLGASAVLRKLVDAGALALVTTHDLALAELAEGIGTKARNVHFEDQVQNGRMVFDYRMRPGVAGQGNALRILQSEGLLEASDLDPPKRAGPG